jgi:hypothetical protein
MTQGSKDDSQDALSTPRERGIFDLHGPWLLVICALGTAVALLALFWGVREVARIEAASAVQRTIGVVDIESALASQRAKYLEIIGRPEASDQDKAAATDFVKASAERINGALATLADECECVLLIRPAVLQHQKIGLIDYTQRLLEVLDSDGTGPKTQQEQKQ